MAKKKIEEISIREAEVLAEVVQTPEVADEYFMLPDEHVEVKYVKRQTGFVTNEGHVAFGGKLEGTSVVLPAKNNRDGKYAQALSPKEQKGLEQLMGVDHNYLSIHKPLNNYWDTIKINLPKEGIFLNLNNPYDFIKYKVLLTYVDYISPSILDTHTKRSYKYEIVRASDQQNKNKSTVNYAIEAYKQFGKIEDSREQLAGVLRVMSGKSASTKDHDWLISEVGKLVADSPKRFVEVLTDPNYKIKLFIEKAISKKAISRMRGKYSTKDGIELCEEGEQPTLVNAIKFLKAIKNQEIKLAIEAGF